MADGWQIDFIGGNQLNSGKAIGDVINGDEAEKECVCGGVQLRRRPAASTNAFSHCRVRTNIPSCTDCKTQLEKKEKRRVECIKFIVNFMTIYGIIFD